jgi:hypothetical protein
MKRTNCSVAIVRKCEINSDVILRRARALARDRLEGWQHAPSLWPSFETRAFGALLRMTL